MPGAVFLLNTPYSAETAWDHLPREVQEQMVEKRLRFYVIDAYKVARDAGLGVLLGAHLEIGLGPLLTRLLEKGWGKSALGRRIMASPGIRDWFYYRARKSTRPKLAKLADKHIVFIGDAAAPAKTRDATASAFNAALLKGGAPT